MLDNEVFSLTDFASKTLGEFLAQPLPEICRRYVKIKDGELVPVSKKTEKLLHLIYTIKDKLYELETIEELLDELKNKIEKNDEEECSD